MMLDRLLKDWDRFVAERRKRYDDVSEMEALGPYSWEAVREYMLDALVFEFSNVQDYIISVGKQSWTPSDIPNVMPPAQRTWAEWFSRVEPGAERFIESPDDGTFYEDPALVITCDLPGPLPTLWDVKKFGALTDLWQDEDGGLYFNAFWFAELQDGRMAFMGSWCFACDHLGKWLDLAAPWQRFGDGSVRDSAQYRCRVGTAMSPLLLGFSFLHCKNVTIHTNEPPECLQRARKRRNRPPMITYKTLEIEPMKQVLRTEGQVEKVGLKQALHICRGHFKDYREKGLFGMESRKGIYWWDMHVRGTPASGVVVKDYKVLAPDKDRQ